MINETIIIDNNNNRAFYKYKFKITKLSRNFYFLKFPSRIEKRIKDVFSFPEQILLLNTIRNCVYMQTNRFLMQKYLHTEFCNSCLHVLLAHLDIQYLHISKKRNNYDIIVQTNWRKVYNTEISGQQIDNCSYVYEDVYFAAGKK